MCVLLVKGRGHKSDTSGMSKQTENPRGESDLEAVPAFPAALLSLSGPVRPRGGGGALAHYVRVIRRRAWPVAAFVAATLALTWAVSANLQPVFESTVTINVERQAQPAGADSARRRPTSREVESDLQTQLRIVLSDPVLRPVAQKFGLLERENQLKGLSNEAAAAVRNSSTALKGLAVARVPDAYLIQVSYRSGDPRLSADVANAIAQSYFEQLYRLQGAEARSDSGLAAEQLAELKARRERSGQALAQFEAANRKSSGSGQRAAPTAAEWTAAVADRTKAEAAWNAVKAGSPDALKAFGAADTLERLQERLNEAQEKSADLKASNGPGDPAYQKQQAQAQDIQQQYDSLKNEIAAKAEAEYRKAFAREQLMQKNLAQPRSVSGHADSGSPEYLQLKNQADADRQSYEEALARSQDDTLAAGSRGRNPAIADPARPALMPVYPDTPLNLAVAGVLSLLLGMGAVVLLDRLDGSIRDPEDVERLLGAPLLGSLPLVRSPESLAGAARSSAAMLRPGNARQTRQAEPAAHEIAEFDEAIRLLRNSLVLLDPDRRLNSVLFTSPAGGEGKTTVAMHLAMAHAEQGKRTLLVDADLRQPDLDKRLGIAEVGLGITGVVGGESSWDEAVIQAPFLPNLYLLPAGSTPGALPELAGSSLPEIIQEATRAFDLVVVDAPPIPGYAEPMQLAVAVDGVVVVAAMGKTNRQAVALTLETLRRLRANPLGVLLNRVSKGNARQ